MARHLTSLDARIGRACDADWTEMTAVEFGRHCAACGRDVVDLTGLTRAQAKLRLQSQPSDKPCLRLRVDRSGSTRFVAPPARRWLSGLVVSAQALSLGCSTAAQPSGRTAAPVVQPASQSTDSAEEPDLWMSSRARVRTGARWLNWQTDPNTPIPDEVLEAWIAEHKEVLATARAAWCDPASDMGNDEDCLRALPLASDADFAGFVRARQALEALRRAEAELRRVEAARNAVSRRAPLTVADLTRARELLRPIATRYGHDPDEDLLVLGGM